MERIDIAEQPPHESDLSGSPTNTKQDWKRLVPGLLISIISLVVVLYLAKPGELYRALKLADFRLVVAGVGAGLIWLLVRSIAWRTLLQKKATLSQVFFTVNEGYLLNNVLPFRLGEVARAFLLGHKAQLNFWEVLPTIVIERVLDVAFAAGLLLTTLPFVVGATWARQAALVSVLLVMIGLGVLYLLARNRDWALIQFSQWSLPSKLGGRWPSLQKESAHRLADLLEGLGVLTDGKLFMWAIAWFTLDWLIALGQYYVIFRAFIPNAPLLWAAFTLGAAALGIAAPSSPGAVGVYELVVVGALALFGVDAATALALAITAHLSQYLLVGVLGTIGLARDGESLIGLYGRARQLSGSQPE